MGTQRLIRHRQFLNGPRAAGSGGSALDSQCNGFFATHMKRLIRAIRRLAAGADVSIDGLLKLDAAMQEIRASVPQEPLKVEVELVEGPIEHCPKCGWHRDQPLTPPPIIDGEVVPTDVRPITRSQPPTAAAKPEPPPVERPHAGGIHDQPGVPLKRYDEPWRTFRRTC